MAEQAKRNMEAASWGVLLIWVGAAFLIGLPLSMNLLGCGVIILGAQVMKKQQKEKLDGFRLIIGALFFLGGLFDMFLPLIPLVPILLILAGAVLLASSLKKKETEE